MPLCFSTLQTSSVSCSKREINALLAQVPELILEGLFVCCVLGRQWGLCHPNRAGSARAQQRSGQLRTGLAPLDPLLPSSTWAPQHTRAQGRAAPAPHLELLGSPLSSPHHSFRGKRASSMLPLPAPRWEKATGPPLLPSLGPRGTQQDSCPLWHP